MLLCTDILALKIGAGLVGNPKSTKPDHMF